MDGTLFGFNIVDAVILALLIVSAIVGWQRGALTSFFALIGLVAGGIIGITIAPYTMAMVNSPTWQPVIGLAGVAVLALVGHAAATMAGQFLANKFRSPQVVGLDSGLGAVLQVVATMVVVWMLTVPLASTKQGTLNDALRGSQMLAATSQVMPPMAARVPAYLAQMLNESGMPVIPSPNATATQPSDNRPPNPNSVNSAMVEAVRSSVVRVLGEAPQCDRLLQGTGFVAAPNTIITNAHVVAGTDKVSIETVAGVAEATVVYYNPQQDIAVLHSEDLPLKPLEMPVAPVDPGTETVVMGFPESGPFSAEAGRVANRLIIDGPDIYGETRIEREAYAVRGTIRQGNSGGPMLGLDGKVIGVVFGQSMEDNKMGYVLTNKQVLDHLDSNLPYWKTATEPRGTASCVAR
ncbi:MarP family serine protease [Corynebacterium ulceribovis]|uniref:MarP family serine protease n=1 Tax=Corynebacterium ulceribovis TaxID=487732 RepID=UPI0003806E62|nr:MarP family serine protease [Corynebacterium ulceribovis]